MDPQKETDLGKSRSLMQHAEGEAKNESVRKCEHFARRILAAIDALEREGLRRKSD
jgi:primosomal protein N''